MSGRGHMMHVTARFFALHRDVVGAPELGIEVEDGTTAGELWSRLAEQYPRLAPARRSLMFAINQAYADPATVLQNGDEVAFIPPVSGGSDSAFQPFMITDAALQSEPLTEYVL